MSDSEDENVLEKQLKMVVLGEQNVGKTCVIKRFCYSEFSRIYVPTVGVDFYSRRITLSGLNEVTVRLTDVSGQEMEGNMLETYLFNANVVLLVYDITNSSSFEILSTWLSKVEKIIENSKHRNIDIAVLGNKSDMEHKRSVRLDKTNHFVNENSLVNYFISARTGENVNSCFTELIANHFKIPLSTIEKDKQLSILKAELILNSARTLSKKNAKVSKKKIKNTNQNNSATCVLQ